MTIAIHYYQTFPGAAPLPPGVRATLESIACRARDADHAWEIVDETLPELVDALDGRVYFEHITD